MSERKVLNKYYPPDFDPSKIPRAKCSKNRQFTVRLMAPCNMKCYTCGEYIAKGKKFNARKEDVENLTYLGIRIYRFYIKCPGCLSEISFRTDPESTDYIIEAGAHRNFQALKLAEEQASREAQDIQDEIDSNPMLLLENRTQQSQYEMDLVESLEDLREMNDRHAGIDLTKIAGKYEKERKLTAEQIQEAETMEAYKAMGYEMIEGKLIKRLREDLLDDESPSTKKIKDENWKASDHLTDGKLLDQSKAQSLKSKLFGLVKKKSSSKDSTAIVTEQSNVSLSMLPPSSIKTASQKMPPPSSNIMPNSSLSLHKSPQAPNKRCNSSLIKIPSPPPFSDKSCSSLDKPCTSTASVTECNIESVVQSSANGGDNSNGTASSLSLLGAYSDSSSDED